MAHRDRLQAVRITSDKRSPVLRQLIESLRGQRLALGAESTGLGRGKRLPERLKRLYEKVGPPALDHVPC
jgi:hypothetical protein